MAPQRERPEHAPEQNAVLIGRRNPEVGEDQDEDVVDRERLLDEVAGQELEAGFASPEPEDPARKGECKSDIDEAHPQGLAQADGAVIPVEHAKIERQQPCNEHRKDDPHPEVHAHPATLPYASQAVTQPAGPSTTVIQGACSDDGYGQHQVA
jgi:hypothetical protein